MKNFWYALSASVASWIFILVPAIMMWPTEIATVLNLLLRGDK